MHRLFAYQIRPFSPNSLLIPLHGVLFLFSSHQNIMKSFQLNLKFSFPQHNVKFSSIFPFAAFHFSSHSPPLTARRLELSMPESLRLLCIGWELRRRWTNGMWKMFHFVKVFKLFLRSFEFLTLLNVKFCEPFFTQNFYTFYMVSNEQRRSIQKSHWLFVFDSNSISNSA